jgi:hypothetical protein
MDPKYKHYEFWDKTFDNVDSTPVKPVVRNDKAWTYGELVDIQVDILKNLDPFLYKQYEKGKLMSKNRNLVNEDYTEILYTTIKCIFQGIREDINNNVESIEDRQDQLLKASTVEGVLIAGLEVLKSMKIKLDINLIFAIMYGYIGESFHQITTSYEDTGSIKH